MCILQTVSKSCIMLKLYTMIDIDNSFCLKMKIFVYCVFYRPELQKCVFYRPVSNSCSKNRMLMKLCTIIDIDYYCICYKIKFFHIAYFTDQNYENVYFTDRLVTLTPQIV